MGFITSASDAVSGLLRNLSFGWTWRFYWTGDTEDKVLITVTRTNKTVDGLFGNLSIDSDSFKCLTLENSGLSIPAGVYQIKWMWSDHFQQIMPTIVVPDRTAIEMHWANYPIQLEGCVALGTEEELSQDCIEQSKDAWIAYIKVVLNQPNLTLRIVEDYGKTETV
jgi:hypothetical protein